MLNVPQTSLLLTPPVCGNKFIESGEQCDCGEPQVMTPLIQAVFFLLKIRSDPTGGKQENLSIMVHLNTAVLLQQPNVII